MTYPAGGVAAGAVGYYIAIAQAIKASGAIVRVESKDFMTILSKTEKPVVIVSQSKFLKTTYKYLTGYKGFVFYTKSSSPLQLLSSVELIQAKQIWIPT